MARVNTARGSASQRGYGAKWRAIRRAVIDEWVAANGSLCPGYRVDSHYSSDLTVDHIVAKKLGGTDHRSNLAVLCRSCNARKGAMAQGE